MKFLYLLVILFTSNGYVQLQDLFIENPMKEFEDGLDTMGATFLENRDPIVQSYLRYDSDESSFRIPSEIPNFNRENTSKEWYVPSDLEKPEGSFSDNDKFREADPNPTHHKHKLKQKIHSHSHTHVHSHSHGVVHEGQSFSNPVVTPIEYFKPGHLQTWHQSQNIHSNHHLINNQNNQFFNQNNLNNQHLINNQNTQFINQNNVNNQQLINNQNTQFTNQHNFNNQHLINNQNTQFTSQNNLNNQHSINNQNSQFVSQNHHLSNGNLHGFPSTNKFIDGGFRKEQSNIQIANINGQNNALTQSISTNNPVLYPHIFSQRETKPMIAEDDIRRMANSDEDNFLTSFSFDNIRNLLEDNTNTDNDENMSSILNVLDERSYLQHRPEVKVSPYFERPFLQDDKPVSARETESFPRSSKTEETNDKVQNDPKSLESTLQSPYLIQVPVNDFFQSSGYSRSGRVERSPEIENEKIIPDKFFNSSLFQKKNLNHTFENYRRIIDSYRTGIKQKEEVLFADFLDGIVSDFRKKNELNSNDIEKKVTKRAASIEKLMRNPNVRLDVPKTLENIGTITKNAFEDERAPMYHVRNLMGSTKNAVLSAMRIPPQNLVVPSNYEIKNINPEEIGDELSENVGAINQKMLSRFGSEDESMESNVVHNDPLGTITKNAFEDERAPMYHVRNLMGSTKNAVLSAMRIPPQNLVVPSNYEIKNINPEEIGDELSENVGAINQKMLSRFGSEDESMESNVVHNDPLGIVDTFTRVGTAIRDSVRSGQNTLSHIGDIAHDARQIFHTTKNTAPKVILPYAKAPVLMRSRFKDDQISSFKKAVLVTPKIVDIKEPLLGSKKMERNYVQMGNFLDALGQNTLSHIGDIAHDARQIFHTTKNTVPKVILPYAKAPVLMRSRFKDDQISPFKKAVLVTPKIVDIKEPLLGSKKMEPNYVKMGNLLDALGISKPDRDQLDLEKIVFKTPGKGDMRVIYIPPIGDLKSIYGHEIPNLKSTQQQLKNIENRNQLSSKLPTEVVGESTRDGLVSTEKIESNKKRKNNQSLKKIGPKNMDTNPPMNDLSSLNEIGKNHYTKEEENEIIDKFLDNIFKTEKKHSKTQSVQNKNEKSIKVSSENNRTNIAEAEHLKSSIRNKNNLSDPKSSSGITDSELRQLFKGVVDEEKDKFPKNKIKSNTLKKNKIQKVPWMKKKVQPRVMLRSRFGNDDRQKEEKTVTLSSTNTDSKGEIEEKEKNDEEAIKRVDEYIANDIFPPADKETQHGWKLGNILELVEDPPVEPHYIGEVKKSVEEPSPSFSSRTLLWSPESEEKQEDEEERVGLDLPMELMKPFMARASTSEAEHVFKNKETEDIEHSSAISENGDEEKNIQDELDSEIVGLKAPTGSRGSTIQSVSNSGTERTFRNGKIVENKPILRENGGETPKYEMMETRKYFNGNGYFSPSKLMKIMKSRVSSFENTERNYNNFENNNSYTSQRENLENHRSNPKENVFENSPTISRKAEENPEYILCSPSSEGGPILCGSAQENNPENERKVGQSRTSMAFSNNLKKPFMGLANKDTVKKFYESYNGGETDVFPVMYGSQEHVLFSDDIE